MNIGYDVYPAAIGLIYVVADNHGVRKVATTENEWQTYKAELGEIKRDPKLCREAIRQIEEYFQGKRREFNLPLIIEGTSFQKQVWEVLGNIPYGEVRSYGAVAAAAGRPKGSRAVGQANRHNPLPILIPCHRVIGKDGSLVGYAGTRTEIKAFLLQLEGLSLADFKKYL
ncbi:MAG: methylated-DNA--[protein]-cysteine S-methyltransferase [Syntrophomonadaceae bacterium]|jgi:methylated-DNA-[protein]-cysteine S-methyltransferase|nr:methylated-DNA--[protein]-cysteine S-methyltransferase [Syntrophomonadaceae bacterium]